MTGQNFLVILVIRNSIDIRLEILHIKFKKKYNIESSCYSSQDGFY
jgi:hypothetical protein